MSRNCSHGMLKCQHALGQVLLCLVFLFRPDTSIKCFHTLHCSGWVWGSAASWDASLQIWQVQRRTCAERAVEVQRLLDIWQRQRAQQEVSAADRREAVAVATKQKR